MHPCDRAKCFGVLLTVFLSFSLAAEETATPPVNETSSDATGTEVPAESETPTDPVIRDGYPESEPTPPPPSRESSVVRATKLVGALAPTRLAPSREISEMLPPSQPFYARYGVRGAAVARQPVRPLRWGDCTFFPTLGSSMLYSDDVVNGKSDIRLTQDAGATLVYRPERDFSLEAGWNSAFNDYVKDVASDYWNHDGDLKLLFNNVGVEGLSVGAYDLYSTTGNAGVFSRELTFLLPEVVFQSFGVRENFIPFEQVTNNVSGVNVRYRNDSILMETRYEFSLTDYETRRASIIDDHDMHNMTASLAFTQFRQFTPFISYTFDRIRPTHGLDPSDENKVIVGARSAVTPRLNFNLNVTGRDISDWQANTTTRDVVFNGDAAYSIRRDIIVGASISAGYQDLHPTSHTRLLGAGANLTVRLRRDLTSYTYASFRQYESSEPQSDTLIYGTRLDYQILRRLSLYANYDRNDTWTGGEHVPLNTAGFGVSARF